MIIKPKDTDYEHMDDDPEDFEDVIRTPEKKPKQPKKPALTPDNPEYWDAEEGEFDHLRPSRDKRFYIWLCIGAACLAALITLYFWIFSPYARNDIQYGYVVNLGRRGHIIETFEGRLLPYKSITDTVNPYEGDLVFSVTDGHLAAQLRRLQLANLPARVEYSTYHTVMPWRGESKIIITNVDTANPAKILPPGIPHPTIPVNQSDKKQGSK